MEPTIRCREDGPLVVEMPVRVIDHLGNAFPLPANKPLIALCRCGHSQRKPFCDGTHKTVGFKAAETAPQPVPPPATDATPAAPPTA